MSVTTLPLEALDHFDLRISLETLDDGRLSWNIQHISKQPGACTQLPSDATAQAPCITFKLITTDFSRSIQISPLICEAKKEQELQTTTGM